MNKSYTASTFLTGSNGWAFSVWACDDCEDRNRRDASRELVAHAKGHASNFDAERAAKSAIEKARASSRA